MQEDGIPQHYIPHLEVLPDTPNKTKKWALMLIKSSKIRKSPLGFIDWKWTRIRDVTGVMVLGRIDNQTKPVNKLVTAKPSANRSALDSELQNCIQTQKCLIASKHESN